MDTEEIELEGRRLAGRYVLEAQIASGGMGTVWRARDEVLGRFVAVKILHDRLAQDPDVLERFRLEAVAAARLSHPAVVRVFDTGIDDGVCFIVMELSEGRTLEDVLGGEGPLEPDRAVRIVGHVLDGLAHAHRQGVVHRDVKPGNILVHDSLVKVTDFGIAKAAFAEDDLSTTGNLLGTVNYLAPEQVEGERVDARTDLYSVGVVLYEALTGRPPFKADSHIATAAMRLSTDPVPPRALRAGIPREVDEAVMRALRRDPDERFQSAEEMRSALDRTMPASVRRAPRPRAEPVGTSPGMRSWVLIPLLVLLGAAMAVGVWWLLTTVIPNAVDEGAPGEAGGSATRLAITPVSSHDPLGDGSENDDELGAMVDGDESTSWSTDGYTSALFGNLKDGVGFVLGLDQPSEVVRLRLHTDTPGVSLNVYASDDPGAFDLESPIGSATTDEEVTAVPLEPTEAAYVLVWFTELADDGEGAFRARVNEVAVFASG
jgi:eukaryotic-like serine/threonine-protein kinase